MVRHVGKVFGFLTAVAFFSVVGDETSHAQSAPVLPYWTSLGRVQVDKSGCPSCPVTFNVSGRHRNFGLVSESIYEVVPSGRIDVSCSNDWSYNYFLQPAHHAGLFQMIPNLCPGLDTKKVSLTITSVNLSLPDQDRTVNLFVYGSFG